MGDAILFIVLFCFVLICFASLFLKGSVPMILIIDRTTVDCWQVIQHIITTTYYYVY